MVSHEVEDYTKWRTVFDGHQHAREAAGIVVNGVYQSVDNPNMVTMWGEAPGVETVGAFFQNPANQAAMANAGLKGAPSVKLMHKGM